jgi:NADH-quinone oxidoreductase subunit C
MNSSLLGKDKVFAEMADNAAVAALRGWKAEAVKDAKFEFDELTFTIEPDDIRGACHAVQAAGYNFLSDVTCVDWYPAEPRFHVTYHILSHGMKQRVRLRAEASTMDATMDSITDVWPSANFYEREIFDLFGVRFNGHPNMRRIMMPDDWEGHPLRKDYPVEGYR